MTDIRALLLTDVVDSTQLSARLGDQAMAEVWAAHDRAARDLLVHWRGREIDKTDGMLLLFDAAADAVQYAVAYHRALAGLAEPLRARAGLHVGPVILRENAAADVARGAKPLEVDGLAKPTAARVMSLARGGQTLLTSDARTALDDFLLGRARLHSQSHGHWVMKGVAAPVELFEVGEDRGSFAAPPDSDKVHRVVQVGERWLPYRQIANNLPPQLTSFIGRERELAEIKALLAKTRLLTLLGMGGLGKTRLSLQVAAELMADYPDGVWFLDLAPLRDGALVVSAAAQAMGVREEPGRPLLQTLCAHLKSRRVLLILDNCEHLLKATALLAHAVLKAAAQVALMASSREALRVPGERAYPILPLPVPARGDGFEALSRSTAVRLFVERAREYRPDFDLTPAEAPAVAELVARLEGIPLALELAAARVRSLSVPDINRRLKHRYKLLTDGSELLEERQQTLRALVDWSYDLLTPQEQPVLQRLAVFAGGFDLAAAAAVCGGADNGDQDEDEVADLLGSLVEKSLLAMDARDGSARYRMLETIRDYAGEKLAQGGDPAATAARHCAHFFALAKTAGRGLKGPQRAAWVQRIEADHDNLRAANSLALQGGVDPFIAVKLAVALLDFWLHDGYAAEGRSVVRAALALPAIQASPLALSHALYVGACLATGQSDHAEARQLLQSCLVLRRGLGVPVDIAATLSTLSLSLIQAGDIAAARAAETEALAIFRQLGDRFGEAIGLMHLGQIGAYEGNDAQAQADFSQGLVIARDIHHPAVEGELVLLLGTVALEAGDLAQATSHFARAQGICHAAADKRGEASAHWWLGRAALLAGRLELARVQLAASLQAFRDFEMREELLGCLEDHALLATAMVRPGVAARLAAATALPRDRLKLPRVPRHELRWQAYIAGLQAAIDEAALDEAWREGHAWSINEAVDAALALSRA